MVKSQDVRESPLGIQQIHDGAFAATLRVLLGDWIDVAAPRIACGMIGSRQGWVEAPYVDCPAGKMLSPYRSSERRVASFRSSPARAAATRRAFPT